MFYLPIKPPHFDFLELYLRVASNVVFYIAYELHPSRIVIPALILLHGLLLYFRSPQLRYTQATYHPPLDRHYVVDCRFGFPATYMVFACIMLLPNYIQYLKNRVRRVRVYATNSKLLGYYVVNILQNVVILAHVTISRPLREPPRKFITDGVATFGVVQSTRFGSFMRRALKLLLFFLAGYFITIPFPESFPTSQDLDIRTALIQYRLYLKSWAKKEELQRETLHQYEVLMAKLERGPSPPVVDFEADAFNMATNNCASKTCTPFLADLYKVESVDNAALTGVGTGQVTHMGKAKYVFLDDDGKDVAADDHEVIVCPNLPSRILSIPS
jgi:hypothetical protein